MRTITAVRLAMSVLWLGLMIVNWDVVWLCLFCITAVDIIDSVDTMDY